LRTLENGEEIGWIFDRNGILEFACFDILKDWTLCGGVGCWVLVLGYAVGGCNVVLVGS
jgi:hypothetical protein